MTKAEFYKLKTKMMKLDAMMKRIGEINSALTPPTPNIATPDEKFELSIDLVFSYKAVFPNEGKKTVVLSDPDISNLVKEQVISTLREYVHKLEKEFEVYNG